MHKVLIGLTSYNDLSLLRESLPALEELRLNLPADVAIMDTAHNDIIRDFLKQEFPHFKYHRHPEGNIGYGRAYSELLRAHPGYTYFLLVTSDVLMHPVSVKKIISAMDEDEELMMCTGKIHYWDLVNHRKTDRIDSLGIAAEKRHHFYDRGHGEQDHGQYDDVLEDVFGFTGAVFLIRTSVIPKLHGHSWQLFDDRFWMYKEDIDLSYRLRWMGAGMKMFSDVWAWHARSVGNKAGQSLLGLSKADQGKRAYARLHSYKNHFLLLKNNFTWRYGLRAVLSMLTHEILKGAYMLVRYPKVFFAGLRTLLFVPGKRSSRAISPKEMLSYFE